MKGSKHSWHYKLVNSVFRSPSQYSLIYLFQLILCAIMWMGMGVVTILMAIVVMFPKIKWRD